MKNVVITKDFGTGKANAQAKAELTKLCDVCGAPVHEDDYYGEYDMWLCPDCFADSEEELMRQANLFR